MLKTKIKSSDNQKLLHQLNSQFYNLLKNLETGDFIQTAHVTKLAYELFMDELCEKLNDHKVN